MGALLKTPNNKGVCLGEVSDDASIVGLIRQVLDRRCAG